MSRRTQYIAMQEARFQALIKDREKLLEQNLELSGRLIATRHEINDASKLTDEEFDAHHDDAPEESEPSHTLGYEA